MEKILSSALKLSAKRLFYLDNYGLKDMGENSVFAIQHIGNLEKSFFEIHLQVGPLPKVVLL